MMRFTIQRFGNTTHLAAHLGEPDLELRPRMAAVGAGLEQERLETRQGGHRQHAATPVLDVGGMDDGVPQQALCVDEDVPLPAFNLLASVGAMWVRAPPSMMAAVGPASRPACSRPRTCNA